jgi:hypothetical protein
MKTASTYSKNRAKKRAKEGESRKRRQRGEKTKMRENLKERLK